MMVVMGGEGVVERENSNNRIVTLKCQTEIWADNILLWFSYFSKKIGLDIHTYSLHMRIFALFKLCCALLSWKIIKKKK